VARRTLDRLISPASLTLVALLLSLTLGPAYDDRNRTAGLFSVAFSLTLVLLASVMSARSRITTLAVITTVGVFAATVAVALIPPNALDDNASKWGLSRVVLDLWPHFSAPTIVGIAPLFGLRGQMPANTVGFLAALAPPAAISLAATLRSRTAAAYWIAVCALGALAVLATGSRGAALSAAVGVIVSVLAVRGYRWTYIATVVATTMVLVLGWLALNNADDPDLFGRQGRLGIWFVALYYAAAEPLHGLGYGVFTHLDPGYFNAHNAYLETLLDFGVLGLAAVISALVSSFRAAARLSESDSRSVRVVGVTAVACLSALAVSAQFDSVIGMPIPLVNGTVSILMPLPFVLIALPFGLRGHALSGPTQMPRPTPTRERDKAYSTRVSEDLRLRHD